MTAVPVLHLSTSIINCVHQDLLLTNFIIYWLKVQFLWQRAVSNFVSQKDAMILERYTCFWQNKINNKCACSRFFLLLTLNDLLPSAHWISQQYSWLIDYYLLLQQTFTHACSGCLVRDNISRTVTILDQAIPRAGITVLFPFNPLIRRQNKKVSW